MSEEFIREVDEDLRHKQLTSFWKKFGPYLITFLVGIVLFVAGNVTLKNYNESKYAEVAELYGKAEQSVIANDMDEALKTLDQLTTTEVDGYQILVAFKQADIDLNKGDKDKAVAALDKLASASDVEMVFRDLARLKAAMIVLDTASYEDMQKRLAPLTVEGNTWKYMAKELLAMSAIAAGKVEDGKKLLVELEQDLEAPQDVKRRAKDFKSVIE